MRLNLRTDIVRRTLSLCCSRNRAQRGRLQLDNEETDNPVLLAG